MAEPFLSGSRDIKGISHAYGGDLRVLRERQTDTAAALDLARARTLPAGSPRLLVVVYDGGSIPSTTPKVYLTHPVLNTGTESEGSAGGLSADTATTVPVVVLRGNPSAGDYLTAYECSNRWISEEGGSSGSPTGVPCAPCAIPATNLTISWSNIFTGAGSDTLVLSGYPLTPQWATAGCSGGSGDITMSLACVSGSIELRVNYWTSGFCPTGDTSYCSNLVVSPRHLALAASCSPFSLLFTCGAACSFLSASGYTAFTITP
jgi:hypothetical protein